MEWTLSEPAAGDIVRMEFSDGLYHLGIYVSDDEVIQFGLPPLRPVPSESVTVLATDIDGFLCGRFLEVAKLDRAERKRARKPEETVAYARSRLGEGGYHVINNNCEHFVNECVFGVRRSLQAEAALKAAGARNKK